MFSKKATKIDEIFTVDLTLFSKKNYVILSYLKFMFSKKATKIDEIFIVDLTLCSKCQIYGEDFFYF